MKYFAVVGRSNSGKTTLVEKLIRHYRDSGIRVATLKSIQRRFDVDRPGKDTWRHREAGALAGAITNGKSFAFVADIENEESPLDLVHRHFPGYDLVIIEGYKEGDLDKIEVVGDSPEPPLYRQGDTSRIKFLVSDRDIEGPLSLYRRNDLEGIVRAIEELIL